MVHAALPEEAKVDFGKVNGTFLSLGFSTREKVENFLKNSPSFWRPFLRPRDQALGTSHSDFCVILPGSLSHLASLSSSSSLLSQPHREPFLPFLPFTLLFYLPTSGPKDGVGRAWSGRSTLLHTEERLRCCSAD